MQKNEWPLMCFLITLSYKDRKVLRILVKKESHIKETFIVIFEIFIEFPMAAVPFEAEKIPSPAQEPVFDNNGKISFEI